MAIVSSHTLNGVDGSHAGGIAVTLRNLKTGTMVFETAMDEAGRLAQDIGATDTQAEYELVFYTGPYWDARPAGDHGARIVDQVVFRFRMPDTKGRYHIPVILSPHSYSLWCSTEHG